jgi:hypothetical protein
VEVNGIGDVAWVMALYPLDPSLVSEWTGEEPLVGSANTVVYYPGAGGVLDYQFSEDDLLWGVSTMGGRRHRACGLDRGHDHEFRVWWHGSAPAQPRHRAPVARPGCE